MNRAVYPARIALLVMHLREPFRHSIVHLRSCPERSKDTSIDNMSDDPSSIEGVISKLITKFILNGGVMGE
jgi:hypothetical protein